MCNSLFVVVRRVLAIVCWSLKCVVFMPYVAYCLLIVGWCLLFACCPSFRVRCLLCVA